MAAPISGAQLRLRTLPVALATLGLVLGINSLHAEPTVLAPAPETTVAQTSPVATPPAATAETPKPEFKSTARGLVIGAGFALGNYGEAIPGSVMYETKGIQSIDGRKYLLQWDAAGGATGGYAGNEHPGFYFAGAKLNLSGELGYRAMPTSNWSPYVSVGGQVAGTAVAVIGLPPDGYYAANSTSGLSGVRGVAATRFSLGSSYLDPKHSLLLTAFVQEALRSPGSAASGAAYTEVGLHAQFDVTQSWSIMLEALYGKTGQQTDPVFNAINQGTHMEAVASVRKMFGKWWVGLDGKLSEDTNKTIYSNIPNTYNTATPTYPSIGLSLGVPIQ